MPLPIEIRNTVVEYCDAHLLKKEEVAEMFDFVNEPALQKTLEAEFYAARYIYKLGEALFAADERLHAHNKFQIIQYASIYEAIIVHMLWKVFDGHPAVTAIEYHTAIKKSVKLPNAISLTLSDSSEEILLCVETLQKTPRVSIKFDDKVDAAVSIGFLDIVLGEEIKNFYKLRNAIHIESAIKNDVKYALDSSMLAFLRLQPFTRGIRDFLKTGVLSEEAKIKQRAEVVAVEIPQAV